jgi:hypothetical protein
MSHVILRLLITMQQLRPCLLSSPFFKHHLTPSLFCLSNLTLTLECVPLQVSGPRKISSNNTARGSCGRNLSWNSVTNVLQLNSAATSLPGSQSLSSERMCWAVSFLFMHLWVCEGQAQFNSWVVQGRLMGCGVWVVY